MSLDVLDASELDLDLKIILNETNNARYLNEYNKVKKKNFDHMENKKLFNFTKFQVNFKTLLFKKGKGLFNCETARSNRTLTVTGEPFWTALLHH